MSNRSLSLAAMRGRVARALAGLAMAITLHAAPARAAESCAVTLATPTHLEPAENVGDYRDVLRLCRGDGGRAVAIRTLTLSGQEVLLLADPEKLTTRLESAVCWTCEDVEESRVAGTRLMRAVEKSAEAPGLERRGFLQNAGLVHGRAPGSYFTGDLCPSSKPMDRAFLSRLPTERPPTPIALSISGLWLKHHFDDYRWLLDRQADGAFVITWTNHSYHHQFKRGVPFDRNFMNSPGVDPDREILDTEQLLIANGQTPSLFFRFPGLISSAPLMQAAREKHLISLGADAWLADGGKPKPGSIILVHPNGNEPVGLKMFDRDLTSGLIAEPFEPLTKAPN